MTEMMFDTPPPCQARLIRESDTITIAVVGQPGAGKTAFINLASGANLGVSSGPQFCTDGVMETEKFEICGRTVRLIDTPGFDGTVKSDVEISVLISSFVESRYGEGTTLHGILYLHPISNNLQNGASIDSFRLFKNLCNDESLNNFVIVTTMWDQVVPTEGELRENEVLTDARFIKPALDNGAKAMRHNNTTLSAHSIIATLFKDNPPTLKTPTETTNQEKTPIKQNITIAVFGLTGAGKSAFINLASGANFKVSDRLESCTNSILVTNEFKVGEHTVRLVDTPGFDDTDKSDVEVLKLISSFLESQYGKGSRLNGILYFHRISDNRMGGASRQSFRLFRKLCGNSCLKNVIVVTTMWDRVEKAEGERRENELMTDGDFFKPAVDDGAEFMRHNNTTASTHDIISAVFKNLPTALTIQTEIADQKKSLMKTSAGRELESNLLSLQEKYTRMMEEIETEMRSTMGNDVKAKKELIQEVIKSRRQLVRIKNDLNNLHVKEAMQLVIVKKMWNDMAKGEKVLTILKRSRGARDVTKMTQFWAALGDTNRMVDKFSLVFDRHPIPQKNNNGLPDTINSFSTAQVAEAEQWVDSNPKDFKEMDKIMGDAIRSAQRRQKSSSWVFWLFR